MYRLADCYMEPEVKARAKGWILQNITLETVRCYDDYLESQHQRVTLTETYRTGPL